VAHIDIERGGVETPLEQLRRRKHPNCILCGGKDCLGLGLEFTATDDGGVSAVVKCDELLQSYTGVLHGGIIALLLDGAMTNCLFAAGVAAVTGEMNIRYLHSAAVDRPMHLTARVTRSRPPLYFVESEASQDGAVVARASAKFMIP
jgi:uncharacterized protein (TIGR00369 family)